MDAPKLQREDTVECAICLQPCMQPVQLPCTHVFCFLCAKGIAMQSRKCALCRSDIPSDFIYKPSQFTKADKTQRLASAARYVWFYEGYNGWWQYDERTCAEIETAFTKKEKSVDVLVAGSVYVIDFENQIQYQRNRSSRKRKIKRDFETASKKGVAGIKVSPQKLVAAPQPSSSSDVGTSTGNVPQNNDSDISMVTKQTTDAGIDQDMRQIPLGEDQNLTDSSANTAAFNAAPPVDLVRAVSDTTGSQHQTTPNLFRYNTLSHSANSTNEPME